jgi:uncharacterized protein
MIGIDDARRLGRAGLAQLEANRERIDDLNVYPVPDGDTGTNLTLTVRSVVEALERSEAEGIAELARELTRAALMGARGNSGVIFSQIVRGFAEALAANGRVDGTTLAQAFRSASDAAYRAVPHPVEGTMLSVVREMAEEAERDDVRALLGVDLLRRIVERGEDAVRRTPDQLAVLREAGVVDAGGAGLLEIARGLAAAAAGEEITGPAAGLHVEPALHAIHLETPKFRYCTVFVVEGPGLDAGEIERELEPLGDSLLVVGDETALKVHIHTDTPGAALAIGTARGVVECVEIANMHRQTAEREARLRGTSASVTASGPLESIPTLATGLVVVAAGEGNRRLFESAGATRLVEGGQTMNPATADLVAAIEATPADDVIILPNNSNVLLSAEQAAGLVSKRVRVVPSTSVQAGLAAIVRFVSSEPLEVNEAAMRDALASVATGEVTQASRDVELDGVAVRKGAWLGLADGIAVACSDDFDAVVVAVAERLLAGGRSLLVLLTGASEPDLEPLLSHIAGTQPEVEVEVHQGGQPHYPLLLSAE